MTANLHGSGPRVSVRRVVFFATALTTVATPTACARTDAGRGADAAVAVNAADAATALPTTSSEPIASKERACEALAQARCTKLASCGATAFAIREGSVSACIETTKLVCLRVRAPAESTLTATALDGCAAALASASCDEAWAGHSPACKRMPGTIAEGAACTFDAQCEGGLCSRHPTEACGVCARGGRPGDACGPAAPCGHGNLACLKGRCVERRATGEACTTSAECGSTLACAGGKCAKPLGAGEACVVDGDGADCDFLEGLYCDAASKRCKALAVSNEGEPCGAKHAGHECRGDLACAGDVCRAELPLGRACTTKTACRPPAECVAGTCQIPDRSACP